MPYSEGIVVDRPEPVGDYKVLDSRISLGISGHIADLLHSIEGSCAVMDLYLVPHGLMVMEAVRSFQFTGVDKTIKTIGEAVDSDITYVVNNALAENRLGAARVVLSNLLEHDVPVAVSQFTKDLIVEAGEKVDAKLGTSFASQLEERVNISFPAIDASIYTKVENDHKTLEKILKERGLEKDGYVMFLSRIAPAKGVDDLLDAWQGSEFEGKKDLIICGNGPSKEAISERAKTMERIHVLDDVSDEEKPYLLYGSAAYCLPSKARPEFVETFGIAVAEKMLAGGSGPVITTRTGGIPEATGGNCLEHEPGDVEDLRACLNKAATMSDEEKAKLSEKAREFAMQFDRAAILDKLFASFE